MLAGSRRVLLGVTGGIAAYKSAHLARLLTGAGAEVTVVMTESATRFVGPDTFAALTGRPRTRRCGSARARSCTSGWPTRPTSSSWRLPPPTCSRSSRTGIADDLLTSTLLEYRGPAGGRAGDAHRACGSTPRRAATSRRSRGRGVRFAGPVDGPARARRRGHRPHGRAGGHRRRGARGRSTVPSDGDLADRVVVVTAGPTYEADRPRAIHRQPLERHDGRRGRGRGRPARRRRAAGPGPRHGRSASRRRVVRVTTAEQMRDAVIAHLPTTPTRSSWPRRSPTSGRSRPPTPKLKKDDGVPELMLEPTPDILRELGERAAAGRAGRVRGRDDRRGGGRARQARAQARRPLVANEVGREGTGFGSETNHAAILDAAGDDIALRDWTKRELASAIVDRIERAGRRVADGSASAARLPPP